MVSLAFARVVVNVSTGPEVLKPIRGMKERRLSAILTNPAFNNTMLKDTVKELSRNREV